MKEKRDTSRPVSVSEANILMKGVKERYSNARTKSHEIFHNTYEYTEKFSKISDKNTIEMLNGFLTGLGMNDEEKALFLTILPLTAHEARLLIPTLSRFNQDIIETAICKIKETTCV